jgi:hypothetical protein
MTFTANSLGALPNLGAEAIATFSTFIIGKVQPLVPAAA